MFPATSSKNRRLWNITVTSLLLTVVIRTCFAVSLPFKSVRQLVPPSHPPPRSELPMRDDWNYENTPKFCEMLMMNPLPQLHNCSRRNTDMQCVDGTFQMFSQMHQDYYLFTRHFSKLARRGVYLDVAANEPIGLSNTFFMDKCLGWSGLCVEAQPGMVSKLYQQRTCGLVPTCVSDRVSSVSFAMMGGLSGIVDTNKNKRSLENSKDGVVTVRMTCTTLEFALRKNRIAKIDYLSLDVEGHELKVLKGINWDDVIINVMTVETQADTRKNVEDFLVSKGYRRHWPDDYDDRSKRTGQLWEDMIFLHKTVTFGKPE